MCDPQEWQPGSVQLLLAASADVHATEDGTPVLHCAVVYRGDVDEVSCFTSQVSID
jgi:hypothetical protein